MMDREKECPLTSSVSTGVKKWNLLIVDDNETICALLSAVLNSGNCSVSFALSGAKALEMLREQPFDICFLDLRLRDADTHEMMIQIRKQRPSTRIVMITGGDPDEAEMKAIRKHSVLLLVKPFDLFLLEGIVREIMEKNITTYQNYETVVATLTGEKRRHIRQPFTGSQTYALHQSGAPGFDVRSSAHTIDISQTGLGIRTSIPLEPGRIVRLSNNNEIICGIVRWSVAGEQEATYRAGIQFVNFND
jgi:CheY-like chemotaxis protein